MTAIMTPWQRFTGLLKLERSEIRQLFYYAIFTGLVTLSLPLGIQAIVNLIQGAQISTSWIVLVVLVTLGVGFQGTLQLMQVRILENIQQRIFTRASFEFAYRFPKVKMEELRDYYPPELANRFFDILTVQKGLSKILIDFPAAILQIVFGLILLSFYHPFFILYGLLLLVVLAVVFRYTARKGLETSLEESKSKYRVAHWIQEIARSLISLKLSGKTNFAMSKNDTLTMSYLEHRESHFKVLVLQFIQMIGFKILVTAGLLIIGGLLVLNQEMNIGQFVAAELIILLVIGSVEKLITGLESFYDILTSLEKIGQVVDKELEAQEGENPFTDTEKLTIDLEEINYNSTEGKVILNDISMKIVQGEHSYIHGISESGKTTLFHLLSGLIQPHKGAFYINNISIKSILPNSYRSYVSQVLPEQTPFEGTIIENITLGDPSISRNRVNQTLESLGLLDFVKMQPKGLQTIIYPEGQQIPYSISRRIVLARAIINEPKLLILESPFDYFEASGANRLISYLTAPENPWTLVVGGTNSAWKQHCKHHFELNRGVLTALN